MYLQSFTKYLRSTLILMWNGALRGKNLFASINNFFLAGTLGTRLSVFSGSAAREATHVYHVFK